MSEKSLKNQAKMNSLGKVQPKTGEWIKDYVREARKIYRRGNSTYEGMLNILNEKWVPLEVTKEYAKEIAKKIVLWIHEMDETVWLPSDEEIAEKVEELFKSEH